MITASATIL